MSESQSQISATSGKRIKQSGFTLVEAMVSVVLVLILVFLVTDVGTLFVKSDLDSRNRMASHDLAQSLMEELVIASTADARLKLGNHSEDYDQQFLLTSTNPYYRVTWTVRADVPTPGVSTIDLTVTTVIDTPVTVTMSYSRNFVAKP